MHAKETVRRPWSVWAKGVMAAALILSLVQGLPRRLVIIGPPQAVVTHNPKIGIHTRLTDEVEPWKVQRTFEMVREMGSPWAVEYFPWGYYEPQPGRYRWEHPDLVVAHATAQGITLLARIDFVPEWARPKETTFRYLDRDHWEDYAAFVQAFAERYGSRVPYIIVWNEPNLSFEWGYRPPDPEAYTGLLCLTYARVKAVRPEVQILAAGLAPTLEPEGSALGMSDLLFLERMYEHGAGACFDGLAIHAYGLTSPPDDPPDPQALNFRRAELLRAIMVAHGDAEKPCFITEGGWNDHPRWARAVRPYQRIEYTLGAYQWALEHWDWCRAVCLWVFRYPWDQHTYQDYYSFVTADFIPKPVYMEVANYAHGRPLEFLEP